MSFETLEDLEDTLVALRVERSFALHLIETARPALSLKRHTTPDAELPAGASKFGGDPDLPAHMPWPMRPPFPDAAERQLALRQAAAYWEGRDDACLRHEAAKILATVPLVGEPFPLAFICQLDLTSLSQHGAFFHPLLPKHGRLLVFLDTVCWNGGAASDRGAMRVIWDQSPKELLTRRAAPDPIMRWYEDFEALRGAPKWNDRTSASFFEAKPVFTITHRWDDRFPEGHPRYEEFRDNYNKLRFSAPDRGFEWPGSGTEFGDQIGGWPSPLQHHPEEAAQLHFHGFEDDTHSSEENELLEGATQWQLVLSLTLEHWAETRILCNGRPDTELYVLMREEDLKARRFENAWMIEQST
jgi:uncharacterized protein YwqG